MSDAKEVTKDIAVAIQRKLDADTALAIAFENGRLQLRNAELAAECEGLKAVIANDTENEEAARAIAAEVFGKEWAEGDSLNVPNVVDFVERFRDELAAAQKTIEANKRAMEWALKALRSINGWLDSAYPSLREAREQNYAARHTLTAAIAATDGGVS